MLLNDTFSISGFCDFLKKYKYSKLVKHPGDKSVDDSKTLDANNSVMLTYLANYSLYSILCQGEHENGSIAAGAHM